MGDFEERERIREQLSKMSDDELFELAKKTFAPGLPEIHIGVDPAAADGEYTTLVAATEGEDGRIYVERVATWKDRHARMEEAERIKRWFTQPISWSDIFGTSRTYHIDPNIIEGHAVEVETRPERLLGQGPDAGESEP